jgi:hypothetical protein
MSAQHTPGQMDADAVRAYVAAKWPQAMQSPLAQLFSGVAARDEADTAIEFAGLQSRVSIQAAKQMRSDAMDHALSCIDACDAAGVYYDEETLGHNIESAFGEDLSADECDEIARAAIAKATGSTS